VDGRKDRGFRQKLRNVLAGGLAVLLSVAGVAGADSGAAGSSEERIERLERSIRALSEEVRTLKRDAAKEKLHRAERAKLLQDIRSDLDTVQESKWLDPGSWQNKFTIGGYGEMHANFGESKTADQFDTQHRMPAGVTKDPAGDRTEWTLGVNFYLTPDLVLKADCKLRDDDSSEDLDNLFNLGIGWQF